MTQLRPVSPRPELLVGSDGARIEDPGKTQVGFRGSPLGRERLVFALATNGAGPVQISFGETLRGNGALIADPNGNVIGVSPSVWVHRIVYAPPTADTRRF